MEDWALSSAKYVFVLYVIVSGNYLANIFGCRAQDALNNSMALKHLLGYITMLFYVVLVDGKVGTGPHHQIFMTTLLYFLFVVTTRMEHKYWVAFIILLCANYIVEVYRQHDQTSPQVKERLRTVQRGLMGASAILVCAGLLVYVARKKIEYGNSFSPSTFLLGKTTCAFTKDTGTFKDDVAVLRRLVYN